MVSDEHRVEQAPPQGKRTVHCADALAWLEAQGVLAGCSLITSMPDVSEFPSFTLAEWKDWFVRTASLVLSRCPDDGVTIFFQTDIKKDGTWVDKGYLIQKAAEQLGHSLLWHKVVCRAPPGGVTFGRPAYSHMLCFSRGLRADLSKSTADVLPQAGEVTWTRGMGVQACLVACRYVLDNTPTRTIVDPFCGHGTVLAVANDLGLDAVGVELSRKRARKARALRMPLGDSAPGSEPDSEPDREP
ncbi:SAM-dependent methyltransferase [Vitiosangium sp. GDMCC 1.1324]|uniref:SAM-dependent methyltransferase n=1 Tax=Vitiosangium sp. (strain GDMCC 1.1324) TaxID=2138576 RepID=UPI000D37A3A6|nr:SAM-dependent methyltransferase [Vitiosangium sp. GDMCC 1.1324]PTL84977.1 SAM-dependent methyltransferase [Vitiosangium sp. GDMCC 1.1324]